jgi:hypothetical protein
MSIKPNDQGRRGHQVGKLAGRPGAVMSPRERALREKSEKIQLALYRQERAAEREWQRSQENQVLSPDAVTEGHADRADSNNDSARIGTAKPPAPEHVALPMGSDQPDRVAPQIPTKTPREPKPYQGLRPSPPPKLPTPAPAPVQFHPCRDFYAPAVAEFTAWAASGALSWYGATLGVIREAASNDPAKEWARVSTVAAAVHTAVTAVFACISFVKEVQRRQEIDARGTGHIEPRGRSYANRSRIPTKLKVAVGAGLALLAATLIPIHEVRRRFSYLDSPSWYPRKPYPREYLTTLIRPLRDTQHQSTAGIGNYLFYGKEFEAVQATADSALAGFEAHPNIKPFISSTSSAGVNLDTRWISDNSQSEYPGLASQYIAAIVPGYPESQQSSTPRKLEINLNQIWELGSKCNFNGGNEDSDRILANKAASGFLKLVVHANSFKAFQNGIFLDGFKEGNATAVGKEDVRAGLVQILSLDSFKEADLSAMSCPNSAAYQMVEYAEGSMAYGSNFNGKSSLIEALDPLLDKPGIDVLYKAALGDESLEDTQEANRLVIENMPDIQVPDYRLPSTPEPEPSPESTDGPVNASQEPEPSPERTDPPNRA